MWTGGIIPTSSMCTADEFALMEEEVWAERTSHDTAQKRLAAVALTRLIFGRDAFCPLGEKIALFADMPIECSECHKLCPSTLRRPYSLLHLYEVFRNKSPPRYYSEQEMTTSSRIQWRKGFWCLQCWKDWHKQKRDVHENLLKQ